MLRKFFLITCGATMGALFVAGPAAAKDGSTFQRSKMATYVSEVGCSVGIDVISVCRLSDGTSVVANLAFQTTTPADDECRNVKGLSDKLLLNSEYVTDGPIATLLCRFH